MEEAGAERGRGWMAEARTEKGGEEDAGSTQSCTRASIFKCRAWRILIESA